MAFVVENVRDVPPRPEDTIYEQPLSERMRTFLRLEFLYQQTLFHAEMDADLATRAAISGLLEISAILTRGDVRSEVLKEAERQVNQLQGYASQPGVDSARLSSFISNLMRARAAIDDTGPHYLQEIKDCEFLSAIKHRSAIPGGTCEFDLPVYSHWLRQPYDVRQTDFGRWIGALQPICDGVMEVLWLIRESALPQRLVAESGMYQHSVERDTECRLLRVRTEHADALYPEVSGSPQRFTIRFLRWSGVDQRAEQTDEAVNFTLSIC